MDIDVDQLLFDQELDYTNASINSKEQYGY